MARRLFREYRFEGEAPRELSCESAKVSRRLPTSECEHTLLCDTLGLAADLAAQCKIPPPYRAIPFRDSIAEGGIARSRLVFIGYRASIAEIPFLGGGIAPPLRMLSKGGNAQKRGGGVSHPIGHVETAKTP